MTRIKGGPKISTEGLTLVFDAANSNSFTEGSSIIRDLSPNLYSGTLDSVTYSSSDNGYLTFSSGATSYISTNYVQPTQDLTQSFSWNVWFYPEENSNGIIIGNRGVPLNFSKLTSNAFEYYINSSPSNISSLCPLNVWQNVCITKNNNLISYYRNGNFINSVTTFSVRSSTFPFYVGGEPELIPSECMDGRISYVGVYNSRALSESEIVENFNALRGRYGI